jgi:glycosyltransferase involved in cell wall biosynthesis
MCEKSLFIITTTLNEENEISAHVKYLNNISDNYNIRYAIIDGGSTDNTLSVLQSKCSQKGIFLSGNYTIYQAWNVGVENINGAEYVCFLGVGDRLSELYVKGVLLNANNNHDVLFSNLCKNNKKMISNINPSMMNWTRFPFPHAGTFFHKNLFKKIGKFDEIYKIAGDLEWILRLNRFARVKGFDVRYKYIEKGCICMRPGGVSVGEGKHVPVLIRETIKAHFLHKTPISIKRILYFLIIYIRRIF